MTKLLLGWEDAGEPRSSIGFRMSDRMGDQPARLIEADDESHVLCIAPTGAGKSRGLIIPTLLSWEGPAIVVDVKGELTHTTANYRKRSGQKVVVLDPWRVTTTSPSRLNPLDVLRPTDDLVDGAFSFASLLSGGSAKKDDAFWTERAETLIAGCIALTISKPNSPIGSFYDIWSLLYANDPSYALAEQLDALHKDSDPFVAGAIGSTLSTAEITRAGIISTAQSLMRTFASSSVRESSSETNFSLEAVEQGAPLTIYLVMPWEKLRSHAALLKVWIASLMMIILRRKRRPQTPTLFMLDELAQLGPLDEIRTAATFGRAAGMRALFVLQSYAQLKILYPDYETLVENCGSLVTFGHTTSHMSKALADMLGDISAEALFNMRPEQLAVRTLGAPTRIGRRLDYLKDTLFRGRADANPMFAK